MGQEALHSFCPQADVFPCPLFRRQTDRKKQTEMDRSTDLPNSAEHEYRLGYSAYRNSVIRLSGVAPDMLKQWLAMFFDERRQNRSRKRRKTPIPSLILALKHDQALRYGANQANI